MDMDLVLKFFSSQYDITRALDEKLSEHQKFELVQKLFVPSEAQIKQYGVTQHDRKRYAQPVWLSKFKNLAFSYARQGFFCIPCALFAPEAVGNGGHQLTGHFGANACRRFKDFTDCWENHSKSKFHQFCLEFYENFI